MIGVDIDDLELTDNWYETDDSTAWRDAFPFTPRLGGAAEAENLTVVYAEFDEGNGLGRHTDSEEELLVVREGTVAVTIGDETREFDAGGLVLVPPNEPHGLRNVGDGVARVLAVFPRH